MCTMKNRHITAVIEESGALQALGIYTEQTFNIDQSTTGWNALFNFQTQTLLYLN